VRRPFTTAPLAGEPPRGAAPLPSYGCAPRSGRRGGWTPLPVRVPLARELDWGLGACNFGSEPRRGRPQRPTNGTMGVTGKKKGRMWTPQIGYEEKN
jgi:hypothetical protein